MSGATRRGVLFALAVAGSSSAHAATGIAPPAMYPPGLWQGREQAVLRVLDRLDSHVELVTVPVGGTGAYHTLNIAVQACVSRPETLPADAAANLHLQDTADTSRKPYDGWMLAEEPSLGTYGSPLYDVRVVKCEGGLTAPQAGPLPVPVTPQLTQASVPEDEGGDQNASAPGAPAPSPSPSPSVSGPGQGTGQLSAPARGGPVPLAPQEGAPIPLVPTGPAPQQLVPSAAAPSASAPSTLASPQPLAPPQADPGLE